MRYRAAVRQLASWTFVGGLEQPSDFVRIAREVKNGVDDDGLGFDAVKMPNGKRGTSTRRNC